MLVVVVVVVVVVLVLVAVPHLLFEAVIVILL